MKKDTFGSNQKQFWTLVRVIYVNALFVKFLLELYLNKISYSGTINHFVEVSPPLTFMTMMLSKGGAC